MAVLRPDAGTPATASWTPLRRAAFAGGAAVLVVLLVHAGPAALARSLGAVGWRFLLVVPLGGATAALNALSWRLATSPTRRVPFGVFLRSLLAGEAVNTLAPVGFVGGEVVRFQALRRWIPSDDALVSIALAATAQFAGQVLFIVAAMPAALVAVRASSWRVPVLVTAAAGVLVLVVLISPVVAPSRARRVARLLTRLPGADRLRRLIPPPAVGAARGLVIDLRRRPGDLLLATGAAFAAWQLGAVETQLVLGMLGHEVSYGRAFAVEALSVAIEGVLFFVPARLGTLEGGRVAACMAVGLNAATGLTLGIVRRARELVWAACGLVFLAGMSPGRGGRVPRPLASGVIRGGPPLRG